MKAWSQIFFCFFALLEVQACRLLDHEGRPIAGHHDLKQGIAHGTGAMRAERFCRDCHGEHLEGGPLGQPSCYQCHGKNWQGEQADMILAPSDHVNDHGGFFHHAQLDQPLGTCDTAGCHNPGLRGGGQQSPPSCYLCHQALWER